MQKRLLERMINGVELSGSTNGCCHRLDWVTADILGITRHFSFQLFIKCKRFPTFHHFDVHKWTVPDYMIVDSIHDDLGYPLGIHLCNASFPTGTFYMVMTAITSSMQLRKRHPPRNNLPWFLDWFGSLLEL